MTARFNLVIPRNAAGHLVRNLSSAAPDHWAQGLPFDADGSLAMEAASPTYFSQGLPFTANHRVAYAGAVPSYFQNGGGFSSTHRIACNVGGNDHHEHGVQFGSSAGQVATTDGPPAPTVTQTWVPDGNAYDPAELSPQWELVGGATATGAQISASGIFQITTQTVPEQAVCLTAGGILSPTDVELRVRLISPSAGTTPAFIGCVRVTDANNFVGWRTQNGNIEVFQRVAAAFTSLGSIPNPAPNSIITLRVVGNEVWINNNKLNNTNLLTAGRVGTIQRAWSAGSTDIFDEFSYQVFD